MVAYCGTTSPAVKSNNFIIDDTKETIYLPVKNGTGVKAFAPEFKTVPGVKISPKGARNFTTGPVKYTVSAGNHRKTYDVTVAVDANPVPVLEGYYADPEIIYSDKHKKYYLYPTSDGFTGWSGTYFETFSSKDLINWKKEGVILDLKKDVNWADRNAWAPAAIEKRIDGKYKYFYYFTAAQKIGIAVSDEPAGPFIDSGSPLIDFKLEGVKRWPGDRS